MPKRTDLKKILVLGAGPTVIGQAAELDGAGTQACLALREEGYEVVLVSADPAAVMTDSSVADRVYMEPLTLEYAARILRRERPDAVLPTLGGKGGLDLALRLERKGILRECRSALIGVTADCIEKTESRERLSALCAAAGVPALAPTEESVAGWKEIELELLRDVSDAVVLAGEIENIDPVGVHSGDSMAVLPCQSLPPETRALLRDGAAALLRALGIAGVCGFRFALSPDGADCRLLRVRPRFSRSSALAARAAGYPVAGIAAKAAAGLTLDEIRVGDRSANFDPLPDYIVTKLPRFPFDRFPDAAGGLDTRMKATGEVMAIGRTLPESLMKAVRSLETGLCHLHLPKFDGLEKPALLDYVRRGADDRLCALAQLYRLGAGTEELAAATGIAPVFLEAVRAVTALEPAAAAGPFDRDVLEKAKKLGFSDEYIARLWGTDEGAVRTFRTESGIVPEYLMADACARDDWSSIPYFYASYNGGGRHGVSSRKKVVLLGAGPARIGQGVGLDYSLVRAAAAVKRLGFEAVIVNNNPGAVSTDTAAGDKLYAEPLTAECVMDIVARERPLGVVASLGGPSAERLVPALAAMGAPLLGAGPNALSLCNDRDSFEKLLLTLNIPQPARRAAAGEDEAAAAAALIGYPVLLRPELSGGRALQPAGSEEALRACFRSGAAGDAPLLVEQYIEGRELEADAVCDGRDVFVPGILEHVERTGIHAGDSICVYPSFSVPDAAKGKMLEYTKRLGAAIGAAGLYNVQFVVDKHDRVYVIEVSPRAGRTAPFSAKAAGWPIADIAASALLGRSLREQGIFTLYPEERKKYYVKAPAFSFSSLSGVDTCLSPELKSTGEALGCDRQLTRALYKALQAAGLHVQNYGTVFATIADGDKAEALPLIRRFYDLGFNIEATSGTAAFLKENGIRTHVCAKLSEGSGEILDAIRSGHVTYVLNTRDPDSAVGGTDGMMIRRCAAENNVAIFTSLDTVRVLLDVLEEMTLCAEPLDA